MKSKVWNLSSGHIYGYLYTITLCYKKTDPTCPLNLKDTWPIYLKMIAVPFSSIHHDSVFAKRVLTYCEILGEYGKSWLWPNEPCACYRVCRNSSRKMLSSEEVKGQHKSDKYVAFAASFESKGSCILNLAYDLYISREANWRSQKSNPCEGICQK